MKIKLFLFYIFICTITTWAQPVSSSTDTKGVVIYDKNGTTPISASALVEMRSSTKGMLPPRLTTAQINAIASPAQGLMVYDTDLKCMKLYDGSAWNCLNSNANIGTTPLSSSYAFSITGNASNIGRGIVVDASNNVYVAGHFTNTITLGISPNTITLTSKENSQDVYLAKYSSTGGLLWVNQISGSGEQEAVDLVIDANNNIYITGILTYDTNFGATSGSKTHNGNGYKQTYVAKYSSAGGLLWYSVSSNTNSTCVVASMAKDATGNIYITGQFYGNISLGGTNLASNNTSYDVFVAKINPLTGVFIWALKTGGDNSDDVGDIAVDGAGNVYVIGDYYSNTTIGTTSFTSRGSYDIFLAKYNTSGSFLWAKTCGTTSEDHGTCVAVNATGTDVFFLASFNGTLIFGPGLGTNPITPSPSGNVEMLLAKFNSSGNYVWATYCSSGSIYPSDIIVDSAKNNFYFTGMLYNTANFRSINTPSIFHLSSCSDSEPFIAKYSSNGVLQWAIAATGGGNDAATRMYIKSNTIYTTGYFKYTLNFAYQQLVSTPYYNNTFIWRYSEQ